MFSEGDVFNKGAMFSKEAMFSMGEGDVCCLVKVTKKKKGWYLLKLRMRNQVSSYKTYIRAALRTCTYLYIPTALSKVILLLRIRTLGNF